MDVFMILPFIILIPWICSFSSKLNSKKRGPKDLELLYNLEIMIRDIRESFIVAKNELKN
jgi:hypothetical protein